MYSIFFHLPKCSRPNKTSRCFLHAQGIFNKLPGASVVCSITEGTVNLYHRYRGYKHFFFISDITFSQSADFREPRQNIRFNTLVNTFSAELYKP